MKLFLPMTMVCYQSAKIPPGIAPEEEEIDNYVWRLGEWRRRGRSSSAATVSDDQDEQEEQGFRLDLIYKTTFRCKGVLGIKEPYAWQTNAIQQLVTKKDKR